MIRRTPLLLGALLVASACGTSTTSEPAAQPADQPAATDAPADEATSAGDDGDGEAAPTETDPPADPTTTVSQGDAPAATDPPGDDQADADPPATDAPEEPAGMAWPADGCTTDGSATAVSTVDGSAPQLELRAESAASSPLPAIAVRRVNCDPGWVDLRNELPADRALLVWFWAPH